MKLNLALSLYLADIFRFLILSSTFQQYVAQNINPVNQISNSTCNSEDLNHSLLIECKNSPCVSEKDPIWPLDSSQVIHVQSSRDGERFLVNSMVNLNFKETDIERLWDINSTLYIKTNEIRQVVQGFGTSLDTEKFMVEKRNGILDRTYLPLAKDLFTNLPTGIYFTLLRVPITKATIINNSTTHMLKSLDELMSKVLVDEPSRKLRLILTFDDIEGSLDMIESLKTISFTMKTLSALECWAVGVERDWLLKTSSNEGILGYIQELFSTKNIFGVTTTTKAPSFVDHISKTQSILKGLLVNKQLEPSTGYSILRYIRNYSESFNILSTSGEWPESHYHGNWDNAKHYAVEILKQFEHGSNCFLENSSWLDLLESPTTFRDRSIYSALSGNDIHIRGPMYYAIGHFSRHVIPGSRRLDSRIETSPNMFAAHYSAFKTPSNYVVTIVLNDNEHLLPFRLSIDGTIVTHINMKPKSFNTFIIKL